MNQKLIDDRRQSFRVEMNAMISVSTKIEGIIDANDCFPELQAMALISESIDIDQEINALTDRIKDLTVKKTIDLLKQKLTILSKLLHIEQVQNQKLVTQKIDISEGGCALVSSEILAIDQTVAVALLFSPSYFSLFAMATVTEITEKEDKHLYHLAFQNLTELQKQHLLKHMFKAQTSAAKS